MTVYDILALRYIHNTLPYMKIVPVAFTCYAFVNNLGFSMIAGASVRYYLYSLVGLSSLEITKVVAFCVTAVWLGFLTLEGNISLRSWDRPGLVAPFCAEYGRHPGICRKGASPFLRGDGGHRSCHPVFSVAFTFLLQARRLFPRPLVAVHSPWRCPRAMRAAAGNVTALFLYAIARLLQPAREWSRFPRERENFFTVLKYLNMCHKKAIHIRFLGENRFLRPTIFPTRERENEGRPG